jgi:hypothetical protein
LPDNLTNTIYSKTNAPIPITPLGKIYIKHDPHNIATQPITSELDLHSNDGTGLHDIISTKEVKAILKANATWQVPYTNLAGMTENPRLCGTFSIPVSVLQKSNRFRFQDGSTMIFLGLSSWMHR